MKDSSFYQFALTVRGRKDLQGALAEMIFEDLSFPKYEKSFDVLSEYIETEGNYTLPMSVFDDLYEEYQEWLQF
ncbi:YozE family protein [Staphylococcus schleiferi]|uniref:YozE family protein n=1 Tax=Staphylococcus schleiferi TaxID=1295 RepID=UPI00188973F1|nr:YozE family protein [Staphylococcus schleiferi]MBF1992183.1 YozE family protein [Staphylococcus schleiferi]MBF2037879.1 YozE family protein [Staphylococcus schleiferi]MBF2100117.1 YozE family protein [Staphylococcus schleiferi]MBF2101894.1 YozE family protein [Staphylococcus schleiferi]MBF2104150.1 YozE family protein [Staphylococcus schleiferi]